MKRRKFIYQTSLGVGGLLPAIRNIQKLGLITGPYLATGIKIGEVTDNAAIIWVRLTKDTKPVGFTAPIPKVLYMDDADGTWHPVKYFLDKYKEDRPNRLVKVIYPEGYTVEQLEGAVPGMAGEFRIRYQHVKSGQWQETEWQTVDAEADFSRNISLTGLQPGSAYQLEVQVRPLNSKTHSATLNGRFATAASANEAQPVHFMVTTCHEYNDQDAHGNGGFKIYKHMQSLKPDFMVHTGDVVYYDQLGKSVPLAHWHWQRMFGLGNCIEYYRQVPCYFMKDDHDTWMNDCYPQSKNRFMGEFTFQEGVKIFAQQTPYGPVPYRNFRWGKDLEIWVVEGREFRDDNRIPDSPEKTIWGKEQMAWFQKTFAASDATYRVLVSATPIIGPDRPKKRDNHANSGFAQEGKRIREFLAGQKNVFVVCGDRHWQYVSKDTPTGLMEFSCGPASNEHASGWRKEDVLPEHRYLNIVGGFLGVKVERQQQNAHITFTHYSVDGEALYQEHFSTAV